MGCKTDLPSKKPEVESSRIVTVADIEYKTECVCLHSVTIYNRLEPAPSQFRSIISNEEGSKMATGCDVDLETGAHNGPTESNVDLNETSERLTHLNQKYNVVSNEPNKTDLDQSDKDNITNIGEKDIVHASPIPGAVNHESAGATSSGNRSDDKVLEEVLNDLDILKDRLKTATDIPSILLDVSLNCLKPSTIDYLSYHLDPLSDVMSPEDKLKDYRGLAEWIGLEPVFIKYISRSSDVLKTREIFSKWLTREEEPLPILKNLRECLLAIDRPDVLEDMSVKMALDAVTWKRTQLEARTRREVHAENTSWQLTRHDVVSGKKTMYTACLLYADEDELMAQLITKLYKNAYKDSLFFLPQFDLKQGKYELDTTARVIDERCNKKVVFLLSEYFYASTVCQFAVNYAAAHGTGMGNLIPFHLTRNVSTVPNVLKGIAGIRWFRKATRQHTWQILADCLLAENISNKDLLVEIKERINQMVAKYPEHYLQDPPYEKDIKEPGDPIKVVEPEGTYSMPPSAEIEIQRKKIEEEMQRQKEKESKSKWSLIKHIKKAIFEKILPQSIGSHHNKGQTSSPPSSTSPVMSSPSSITSSSVLSSPSLPSSSSFVASSASSSTNAKKCAKHSDVQSYSLFNNDGSEKGACGGSDLNLIQNDLNVKSDSKPSIHCRYALNISESESTVLRAKIAPTSLAGDKISSKDKINATAKFLKHKHLSEAGFTHDNDSTDNNCSREQMTVPLRSASSYEMKVIKSNVNENESEALIRTVQGDKAENNCDIFDDTAGETNETDALMSNNEGT